MTEKRREITIGAPGNRGDIVISVELDERPEVEETSYDIDAEKLFRVLWGGVPSATVERLFLKLVEAYEEGECTIRRWEHYKRDKGWIE